MHGVAERFSEWIADCGNPVKYNGFWQPNLFTYEFKRPRLFGVCKESHGKKF
ncbi:uncharacterized protein PHALS_02565 [Plasmopara halstedii]|uniref:Uncharacterized protein n=1 Tax=Plasmopara halstedii TaxID=4781 RepID=A0A0P1AZ98_PLAHL|nr:uncharacterized protein PHALS_02565 [Plasmopara halstedii]CEG46145.1 hypothetical protein PHALS_02565 [Plasmopara halstedii]|eukprot:XP_024582514.1 hypothetical protein PHALS_02565 [Plasmopara halstedii]